MTKLKDETSMQVSNAIIKALNVPQDVDTSLKIKGVKIADILTPDSISAIADTAGFYEAYGLPFNDSIALALEEIFFQKEEVA